MVGRRGWMLLALLLTAPMTAPLANVITDWDDKAVSAIQTGTVPPPPTSFRTMAILHLAMFDSVNSIERRYKPYKVQLSAAPDTSKEAAAAAAAAAVLLKLAPDAAADVQSALTSYLAALPEGEAKSNGIKLGQEVAAKILEARANDGASAADAYRPKTRPGVYIPTPITVGSQFPNMTPFALASPSQFRPKPPPSLKSEQWARDYNEIKDLGAKNSTKRTARQTEDARFWLLVGPRAYDPLPRQIVIAKNLDLVDSARFMALFSVAAADAVIAVFDAKYKYEFWRPITAIRNGDIDGNPATERDATWQPIDATPMHPEYPCAHCILSSSVAAVIEGMLGTDEIPEVSLTSPFVPGVTHRFTNLRAYSDEVANARICAGFHYRFSTIAGREMGQKIGAWVVRSVMQPVQAAMAR
ncbi:MAG TPA: vanadium-dependent haloperoxidase [Roseiarcus sp.]|nr:vanadium-dependent haloperoxidase [Roseiarcus sp.]